MVIYYIGVYKMEFTQVVHQRRTVRDLQSKPIPEEVLTRIIEAGLAAPSNDHLRQWNFLVVKDPQVKVQVLAKVSKTFSEEEISGFLNGWAFDENQRQMYFDGVPKQYKMLSHSGALIIPCFKPGTNWLEVNTLNDLNAFASVWCVVENMLLAAANEGIFGVTRIPFPPERLHVRQVLGLPAEWDFPCYLSLGFPESEESSFHQNLYKAGEKTFFNHWGQK